MPLCSREVAADLSREIEGEVENGTWNVGRVAAAQADGERWMELFRVGREALGSRHRAGLDLDRNDTVN